MARFYRLTTAVCLLLAVVPNSASGALHPPFRRAWTSTWNTRDQIHDWRLSGSRLYLVTSKDLASVHTRSGRVLWSHRLSGDWSYDSFVTNGRQLYAIECRSHLAEPSYELVTDAARLVQFDPLTGTALWSHHIIDPYAKLLIRGNRLYGAYDSGVMTAMDSRSHRQLWRTRVTPPDRSKNHSGGIQSGPAAGASSVFVGTGTGQVLSLDAATGHIRWRRPVYEPGKERYLSLTVNAGHIYGSISALGTVLAMDDRNGRIIWRRTLPADELSDPVPLSDTLLVTDNEGYLYSLDAASGRLRTTRALSASREPSISALIISSNRALMIADNGLTAIAPSGRALWSSGLDSGWWCRRVIPTAGGFIATDDFEIVRFRMGRPAEPPRSTVVRRALAAKLVSRLTRLNADERRMLDALGNDAVQQMLPAAKAEVERAPASGDKVPETPTLDETLRIAGRRNTVDIAALYRLTVNPRLRSDILSWLSRQGDPNYSVPTFIDALEHATTDPSWRYNTDEAALDGLTAQSNPESAAYLIRKLSDPTADADLRQAAFVNLARIGGIEGVQAVRAATDHQRTANPLELSSRYKDILPNGMKGTDTDSDGWPNALERFFGSNPENADSDADGLKDSEDRNPLAAPRQLTDAEKVLGAAFQARFRFSGNTRPCRVEFPRGISPFELFGWDGLILPARPRTQEKAEQGEYEGYFAVVSFALPEEGPDGNPVRRRSRNPNTILWNKARNEAKVQVITTYGALMGTWYDVRLKKFGTDWLPIGMKLMGVS